MWQQWFWLKCFVGDSPPSLPNELNWCWSGIHFDQIFRDYLFIGYMIQVFHTSRQNWLYCQTKSSMVDSNMSFSDWQAQKDQSKFVWWPAYAGVIRSSSSIRHTVRQLYISRTVWPSITTFYLNIHTGQVYKNARYDVTSYFRLVVVKVLINGRKWRLRRLRVEFLENSFKWGSQNFTSLWWLIGSTNFADMTSLAVSGQLQSVVKYCTKVHKTGSDGQRVE